MLIFMGVGEILDIPLLLFTIALTLTFMIVLCKKKTKRVPAAVTTTPSGEPKTPEKAAENAQTNDKASKPTQEKEFKKEDKKPEKNDKKIKTPSPFEPFTSTARRRKREESVKQKVTSGFYLPESVQDDTLEKLKSLEEEKTEEELKSISKKKAPDAAAK